VAGRDVWVRRGRRDAAFFVKDPNPLLDVYKLIILAKTKLS
jgi:hypothetical protein